MRGPVRVDGKSYLRLYDFSPRLIPENLDNTTLTSADEASDGTRRVVTTSSSIKDSSVFVTPAKSSLPYAVSSRRVSKEYAGSMLDEEQIVLLTVSRTTIGPEDEAHAVFAERRPFGG